MPVHRVALDANLEDTIARLERTDRIVSTLPHGDGCVIVFTEPKSGKRAAPGERETRPA